MPRLFAAAAIAALTLAAGCHRNTPATLSADHAWVRLAAVPGRPAAAYFSLHGGAAPDRLVRVTSPAVAGVELHESMAGGMRPIAGADVPAGGTLAFAPGGRHAMLFGLDPTVAPGDAIDLRFTMASGRTLDAKAQAVAAGDPAPGMRIRTGRPLTAGEIALARSIFGDAIDYDAVTVNRRTWWPLQPREVVMAPDGHLWLHPKGHAWRDDFAAATPPLQGLFIHEMTHVWQAQTKGRWWLPLMRHPFCRYRYTIVPGKRFADYGIEQQAEIVRDVWAARRSGERTRPGRFCLSNEDLSFPPTDLPHALSTKSIETENANVAIAWHHS